MNTSEINDIRSQSDFKGVTFSKYKKSEVRKELLNCISKNKVEAACNWSCELICSGHYIDLWEIILLALCKYIHLGNPKLPIYIEMRFNNFKEIVQNGYIDNELSMRNNTKIRTLFAEIIGILCYSNKKPSFEIIKINKKEEFNLQNLSSKFKAPNVKFGEKVFKRGDPKELFISINELAYHLINRNLLQSCYWIEWMMEYDGICKKDKTPLHAERRSFAPVKESAQMDIIWIVWELLLLNSPNAITTRILNSLLGLFSIRFTNACKKKRRYILYFAVELITEKVNPNIDMITKENQIVVKGLVSKINNLYKGVKKMKKLQLPIIYLMVLKKKKVILKKQLKN